MRALILIHSFNRATHLRNHSHYQTRNVSVHSFELKWVRCLSKQSMVVQSALFCKNKRVH